MQTEEELSSILPKKDMLLTIGVFDGVHLGHRHLLSELKKRARQQGLLSGVVTFKQHPQEVLLPRTRLPFLTDLAERVELLEKEGVEHVIVLSFTPELAQLGAQRFLGLLKKHLRMRGLVIGPDFALGRSREGNVDTLRALGQDMDFEVVVVPPMTINGEVVSSTAIRQALVEGDMKRVHNLSGRYFSLKGRVIHGTGRGIQMGFPTANLNVDSQHALPADGVYATRAYVDGSTYLSMTNIGTCPTFDGHQRTVEVYLIDYNNNLYARTLRIEVIERLRGEKRFDTVEELKAQITKDIEQGRAILSSGARG